MRTRLGLCLLLFALLAPIVAGDEVPLDFKKSGKLKSGKKFELRVREVVFKALPGAVEDDGSLWGIDGGFPDTVCAEMTLEMDGVAEHIPRKLYQDLVNLEEVGIAEVKGEVQVTIRGGGSDPHAGFVAVFFFREFEIERMVRHDGGGADCIWERTIVHNSMNDPESECELGR